MVRLQVLFQTEDQQASHFHQVLTQHTVLRRAVLSLLLTLLLSFHTKRHLMVSQIHRQSTQVLLDTQRKSVLTTLLTFLTDTSIRVLITLTLTYLVKKSLSMLWSIQRSQSTLTLQSVYLDTLLSSST